MEPTEQNNNIKKVAVTVAAVILAFVLGEHVGRLSGPSKVETREVEKLVYKDITTEDITRGMGFTKTETRVVYRNVVTTITVTPDAGTTTTIADNSIEHVGGTVDGTATETAARTEVVTADREVTVEKTVTLRPSWRVGVLIGATAVPPMLTIAGPLVVGAHGEFRLGQTPLSAGLWALTIPAGGASLSVELP